MAVPFATLDFDRDGRVDLAVVNANEPLCELFANRSKAGHILALRFVGGNDRDEGIARVECARWVWRTSGSGCQWEDTVARASGWRGLFGPK